VPFLKEKGKTWNNQRIKKIGWYTVFFIGILLIFALAIIFGIAVLTKNLQL